MHEIPPNGQGIVALIALGLLQRFDLGSLAPDSVASQHLAIEATKLAFADAYAHVADPAAMRFAPSALLDDAYLDARAKLIDPAKAAVPLPGQPLWRGNPAQSLQHRNFATVAGSTTESWLLSRITTFDIIARAVAVASYDAGVARVLDRSSDLLFGDRAILLDAARRSGAAEDLKVLDRLFTVEPIALGLARGDEDFRLLVDRSLSAFYATGDFGQLYTDTFGEPDERVLLFFRMNTLPE